MFAPYEFVPRPKGRNHPAGSGFLRGMPSSVPYTFDMLELKRRLTPRADRGAQGDAASSAARPSCPSGSAHETSMASAKRARIASWAEQAGH